MKIEWLFEAQSEYRNLLTYYKTTVGVKYAQNFSNKILNAVAQLEQYPLLGVLQQDSLMGKHGFRALFIDRYVCIYKIEEDYIYIYHLADARKNYIYHIFGME